MIHELMDECAPQCNKFKPRGCSDWAEYVWI